LQQPNILIGFQNPFRNLDEIIVHEKGFTGYIYDRCGKCKGAAAFGSHPPAARTTKEPLRTDGSYHLEVG
jgi:hypothetical protein